MGLPVVTSAPSLSGKRVLLRLDLNVPLEHGTVRDAYRIEQSLATLAYLRAAKARTVIVSHIGKGAPEDTLFPVAEYLNNKFPVTFLSKLKSPDNARIVNAMQDGDVVMLENLRHEKADESNDPSFA